MAKSPGEHPAIASAEGNVWVTPPRGAVKGSTDGNHKSRRQRAGTLDRHLLTKHGPGQQFGAVGVPRRAQARPLAHQGGEHDVIGEVRLDRVGIGVEVEHSTAALHRGLRIGDVVEVQPARHGGRTG